MAQRHEVHAAQIDTPHRRCTDVFAHGRDENIRAVVLTSVKRIERVTGPKANWVAWLMTAVMAAWWTQQYIIAHVDPTSFGDVVSVVPAAPGRVTTVVARVDRSRSIDLNCDVRENLFVQDSRSRSVDWVWYEHIPAREIANQEHMTPGTVRYTFRNPVGAATGEATIEVVREHYCTTWHRMFGPRTVSAKYRYMISEAAQ